MKVLRKSLLTGAMETEGLPVVIDVMRAFTTSAVLFSLGLEDLFLVSTADEAFALREQRGCLIAGESQGVKITGFDFGNSPTELLQQGAERFRGQSLVLRTSAGTQGVVAAIQRADRVILGSFVMARAIARYIYEQSTATVVSLIAMGSKADVPAVEDETCADYLEHLLMSASYDHMQAIMQCANNPFIQRGLRGELDYLPPQDILLCLQRDLFDFVLIAEKRDGLIQVKRHFL